MADAWDDSDDDWEKDDDELDARLKKVGIGGSAGAAAPPVFDDEEDLALKEKEVKEKQVHQELKKKGNALLERKMAEQERLIEIEVARKAMELEAELEATLSPDELRKLKQQQIEEADHVLTDDLFGGVDNQNKAGAAAAAGSDKLVLKDLKDHLKHAKTVGAVIKVRGNCPGQTIGCGSRRIARQYIHVIVHTHIRTINVRTKQQHGKVHLATAFLKEVIQECKDVLDDAAVSDIIKTCNVIKNDMVQAAKRKVKYQAQKAKKVDKTAEAKARKLQEELYGENDHYDEYDQVGADYEDSFF